MEENNKILIYTDGSGLTKIDVRMTDDTLWLTQAQMCELYQTSKSNVSEHIKHIFEEGELQEEAVVRKFRTTAADGKKIDTALCALKGLQADSPGHRPGNVGQWNNRPERAKESCYRDYVT